MATRDELEHEIEANPDDAAPFLVYADWLQQRGDPRGELITLQHAGPESHAAQSLLEAHAATFLGPLPELFDSAVWKLGFLERVDFRMGLADPESAVEAVLDHPSGRFLRAFGLTTGDLGARTFDQLVARLARRSLPVMRGIFLFDIGYDDTGELEPLWPAVPNLKNLILRSRTVRLGTLALPKLAYLFVRSVGFDPAIVESILASRRERLAGFDWHFGERGDRLPTPGEIARLFDPERLPALRHLGFPCSSIAPWLGPLLGSPLLAQLETLSFHISEVWPADMALFRSGAAQLRALSSIDLRELRAAPFREELATLLPNARFDDPP